MYQPAPGKPYPHIMVVGQNLPATDSFTDPAWQHTEQQTY